MKKTVLFLFIIFISKSFAQIDDIIKEVQPEVELFEEKNITTSITDAYPVAFWLKDLDKYFKPTVLDEYPSSFSTGYYRIKLQSYCLKAGTYGPTYGDGYLFSPLKGKRSKTVSNIIKKSIEHPDISQQDIQILLWGIIYGAKFTDYSIDFQNRVRPLLTLEEIADLSLDITNVPLDVMPDEIRKVAKYYQDFRSTLTNPASTFSDIEQRAMLQGALPDDLNSKYIKEGNWAYIGNGFYIRAFPEHYSTTYLDVYKRPLSVYTKDGNGRITAITVDDYKVEIVYDDETGRDILSTSGKPDLPIWRFKSVKLSWLDREKLIENTGWIIRGDGKPLKTKGSGAVITLDDDDPTYEEYQKRLEDEKKKMKEVKETAKVYNVKDIQLKLEECKTEFRVVEGIKVNFDQTQPAEPFTLPLDAEVGLTDVSIFQSYLGVNPIICFRDVNVDPGTSINKPTLEKVVSVPATNGKQRIIISERKQK